jgi:hypothetical protein
VDIRIDRLRLQVSGMRPDAAREFGRLLAEHLAAALAAAPPEPDGAQLARLRISVPWPGGQHPGGQHPGGQHPGGQHPGGVRPADAAPAAATAVARALRGAAAARAQVAR